MIHPQDLRPRTRQSDIARPMQFIASHPPVRIRPTAVATLATVLVVLAIYAGVAVLP